ncbi:MAG: arylesterase [Rhodospirillales bacterium]
MLWLIVNVWIGTAAALAAAKPVTITVIGDSLSAGYGLERGDSFPARLKAALEKDGIAARVIGAGVSGDTTAGGLSRLAWALNDKPDLVIVELGANDGLRGLDPAITEKNLDQMIARIKKRDIKVLLTGMQAPPNLGRDYAEAFNGVFPALAEKHGVVFYPFFLEGVAARPALNQDDGKHPNAKGVAVIVERILPYVKDALRQ